jgi:hypothetical protein
VNYEKSLVTCRFNQLHQYDKQNTECPLCEADARYGLSVAPQITQRQFTNLQTPVQPPSYPSYPSPTYSGSTPNIPSKNWWQKLSFKAKIGLGTVAAGVVIFSIGALAGWFGGSASVPVVPSSPLSQLPGNGDVFEPDTQAPTIIHSEPVTTPKPQLTEYSFSFTDTTRLSEYWKKTDGDTWRFEGNSGYLINGGGFLELVDIIPSGLSSYVVEFEVASDGPERHGGISDVGRYVNIFLGKNNDGTYGDLFSLRRLLGSGFGTKLWYYGETNWHGNKYDFTRYDAGTIEYLSNGIELIELEAIGMREFLNVKLVVDNSYVDIFINDVYTFSRDLSSDNSALTFYGVNSAFNQDQHSYFIRNFNIRIDDESPSVDSQQSSTTEQ